MPDRNWTLLRSQEVLDQRIFRLRSDLYRFEPSGEEQEFMVLDTPSWVNVVPITTEGSVVLVRQYRHGIQEVTLEIPGGMIDDGEEPQAAAARELLEETGYVAETIRPLSRVVPNPAVQNNYLYLFVAEGCRNTGKMQLDAFECIDVLESPLADIPELIRNGTISHAMVIAAFAFLGLVPKLTGQ
jgi:ADP-ribose pyrophosphatase